MKSVVSFFTFVFLFLTLSNAFQTETLDQMLDHERLVEFKPSSDGEDPSKILLPTVPDDTKFSPVIEEKEAVTELPAILGTPERADTTNTLTYLDLHSFVFLNRLPVQMDNRFNRFSFPIFRYKYNPRHGCRQLHRFMHHPRRLIGGNEVGFAQVLDMDLKDNEEVDANRHVARNFPEVEGDDLRMVEFRFRGPHLMLPHHGPRHHHHHHDDHDHDEDDQMAEMREVEDDQDHKHDESEKEEQHQHNEHEHEEKQQHKHKDYEHGNSKKYLLKKIRKFLGYF